MSKKNVPNTKFLLRIGVSKKNVPNTKNDMSHFSWPVIFIQNKHKKMYKAKNQIRDINDKQILSAHAKKTSKMDRQSKSGY